MSHSDCDDAIVVLPAEFTGDDQSALAVESLHPDSVAMLCILLPTRPCLLFVLCILAAPHPSLMPHFCSFVVFDSGAVVNH